MESSKRPPPSDTNISQAPQPGVKVGLTTSVDGEGGSSDGGPPEPDSDEVLNPLQVLLQAGLLATGALSAAWLVDRRTSSLLAGVEGVEPVTELQAGVSAGRVSDRHV
ncbi:unnamed protein product [Protopolystoma xenopodis]|uniref:Uncharacterized protein n=1 Tax=Protopolystoma xenopodis TaxID=117903 RepID=A0A448WQP3_9PLAT|nr:unnamed protein product [Protopolystoma xenopodis]